MINFLSLLGAVALTGISAATGLQYNISTKESSLTIDDYSWSFSYNNFLDDDFVHFITSISTQNNSYCYFARLTYVNYGDTIQKTNTNFILGQSSSPTSMYMDFEYWITYYSSINSTSGEQFNVGYLDFFTHYGTESSLHFYRVFLSGGYYDGRFLVEFDNPLENNSNTIYWTDYIIFDNDEDEEGYLLYGGYFGYTSFSEIKQFYTLRTPQQIDYLANYQMSYYPCNMFYIQKTFPLTTFMSYLDRTLTVKFTRFVIGDGDYNSGYNDGYSIGYHDGYDEGMDGGLSDGYQLGYTQGYYDADVSDETATTIFTGIIDVGLIPINFFLACLNFEVFGINIGGFVSALLTVAIVVIIIRMVVGAKQND